MGWVSVLNNREWALVVWFSVFGICASSRKDMRASFGAFIKALLNKWIVITLAMMACYIALIVWPLSLVGLWDLSQLKNTIVWSVFVTFAMLFNITNIQREENYFRNVALANLKATVFVEYLVNAYIFSFPVELIFVPLVSLLTITLVIAERDARHDMLVGCLKRGLSILGWGLIAFALYNISTDFGNFASRTTVIDFLLPILLSLLFLPFIYVLHTCLTYEQFYALLPSLIKDPHLRTYIKRQTALRCRLDMKMLHRFWKILILRRPGTRQQVLDLLRESKSYATQKRQVPLS